MKNMLAKASPPYLRFPCVTPSWDNAARRQSGATIFHGSTPELYKEWLMASVETAKANPAGDQIVFINAWNEWAEGNHLEPCQHWGHAYLKATREALIDEKQ
jgi:lipopolysaccharide biosynthesis protein